MSKTAKFIFTSDFVNYKMSEKHPFNPQRLLITTDLLKTMGLLFNDDIIEPSPATIEQLTLVHDPQYVEAVITAGNENSIKGKTFSYGLGTEDNPVFQNMHTAASLAVGATLKAVELVMEDKAKHAFNISGGLHHAQQTQASGFCIYNDIAVAISWLRKEYDVRVLYIDTDAHHGDGVQWFFYSDPHVLTVSIHETGRYLFPGTGSIEELGVSMGRGYCINLPLEPFTDDTSYLECLEILLKTVTHKFQPDIIISQHGCDTHYLDPLSHLSVTTKTLSCIPKLIHNLAHTKAKGRWVALGGGGYSIWNVVPRAWTILWSHMTDRELQSHIPQTWINKWQKHSSIPLPENIWDNPAEINKNTLVKDIHEKNSITLERLLDNINV